MPRVLCIEDENEMSQLVDMILSREGYQVRLAATGETGLSEARAFQPDVILLDLMMPDMDGWAVYQQLKADTETRTIPVIILTARAQASEQTAARQVAKVQDYIVKPFTPTQLVERVAAVLEHRKHHISDSP